MTIKIGINYGGSHGAIWFVPGFLHGGGAAIDGMAEWGFGGGRA